MLFEVIEHLDSLFFLSVFCDNSEGFGYVGGSPIVFDNSFIAFISRIPVSFVNSPSHLSGPRMSSQAVK
jgi:hypothetical protein